MINKRPNTTTARKRRSNKHRAYDDDGENEKDEIGNYVRVAHSKIPKHRRRRPAAL